MPSIYVACLAAYNEGRLHGGWINIEEDTEPEAIHAGIAGIIESSPTPYAEEWRIDGYEGWEGINPASFSIEQLPALAGAIEEYGEAFASFCNWGACSNNATVEELVDKFKECYIGTYRDLEDWAAEYIADVMDLPEWAECYFDYEKFARSCVMGGDIYADDDGSDGVHVFNNL